MFDQFGNDLVIAPQDAAEFMRQRKLLREARTRWIDEHEMPADYGIKQADGSTFRTGFQIGKIRDDRDYYAESNKTPQTHSDPKQEKELMEGIDAVLRETGDQPRLVVMVTPEGETQGFVVSAADTSVAPPMMEGEDHGQYYARIASAYERAAGGSSGGRPVASVDHLRESPATDSPGNGRAGPSGAGDSEHGGHMLGSDPHAMCADDPDAAIPGPGENYDYWRDPTEPPPERADAGSSSDE